MNMDTHPRMNFGVVALGERGVDERAHAELVHTAKGILGHHMRLQVWTLHTISQYRNMSKYIVTGSTK